MTLKKTHVKNEMRRVSLSTSIPCSNNCGKPFRIHEIVLADDEEHYYHIHCVSYLPAEEKTVVRDLQINDDLGVKSK